MQVLSGQGVNPELLEPRVLQALQVGWELQAHRDQWACRGKEAELDPLDQWVNVVQLDMLANPVLWVRWESLVFLDFLVTQE